MKNRILQAYKDNYAELVKNAKHGEIEEYAYCKGYEEALNFVLSLLETAETYRTARLVDCIDSGTTYGTLRFKTATAEEVQAEIYAVKSRYANNGNDEWTIWDVIDEMPSEWDCTLDRNTDTINI